MSALQLYDSQELLNMESKVASGYVVLMGSAAASKLDRGQINLAFLALTEGNVIDACFGVKSHGGATDASSSRATKTANDAKKMVSEAVRSSDGVRAIAVEAYGKAFQVVMEYNDNVQQLNCLTRCFQWQGIHHQAEESLRGAFRPLSEAIHAAS